MSASVRFNVSGDLVMVSRFKRGSTFIVLTPVGIKDIEYVITRTRREPDGRWTIWAKPVPAAGEAE